MKDPEPSSGASSKWLFILLAAVLFLWLSVLLRFNPAELFIAVPMTALLIYRYRQRRRPVAED